MADTRKKYTPQNIRSAYSRPDTELNWSDCLDFVSWLEETQMTQTVFTVPELFRAYFIYSYHKEKPEINLRVAPVILWELHLNWEEEYDPITLGFSYRVVLNSVRDPIILIGRTYESEGSIWMYGDYILAQNMHPELKKQYYSFRLEDLKMYPAETCQALCSLLSVPYSAKMFQSDNTYTTEKGEVVKGFDPAPLYRNVDAVLSPFDQVRLRIYFDPILRHYGYQTFDFDECPMSDEDVIYLLKFPFRFERDYVEKGKWEKITREDLRQSLFQNMAACWQIGKESRMVLPKVIRPILAQEKGAGI